VHGWIDPFYERARPAVEPGQIWCAQPIALPPRHALKLGKVDPKDDTKLRFRLGDRAEDSFGHPPIHSLGLRSDEALVVAKARRDRLVIVLGGMAGPARAEVGEGGGSASGADAAGVAGAGGDAAGGEAAGGDAAGQALPELDGTPDRRTVTVVPLYDAAGHDAETRRRVARYEFVNAFYLPVHERPPLRESFARLDHAQPVVRDGLTAPSGLRLSADALDALVEWFVACTTGRMPEDSLIVEYRREMLACDSASLDTSSENPG